MTRRNRPFIHVIDLNKQKDTVAMSSDISSLETHRIGRLYRLKEDSTRETRKRVGFHGSVNVSSIEIRTKRPRPKTSMTDKEHVWYASRYKNIFPSHTTQSSQFLPSFCYPLTITSLRSQKDVKRSKSVAHVMAKSNTPDCLIFEERYLTDKQSNILNIEEKNNFPPGKDLSGFETNHSERRKSNEKTDSVNNGSSLNGFEQQNRKISETEYAIYDSSTSGPRIVRIKHDINFTSLTNDEEGDVFLDGGFQDVDLSLDPRTINLSLDDYDI